MHIRHLLILLGLLLSTVACASFSTGNGGASRKSIVEGILLDARCYFAAGAEAGDHTYCLFDSLASNLPAGILTDRGDFFYLTIESSMLAKYAARRLRVRGSLLPGHHLLHPDKIWVNEAENWSTITISAAHNTGCIPSGSALLDRREL